MLFIRPRSLKNNRGYILVGALALAVIVAVAGLHGDFKLATEGGRGTEQGGQHQRQIGHGFASFPKY